MNAKELRDAFANLPSLKVDESNPWDRHRREIRKHVTKDSLEDLTSWSTIVATMHVGENRRLEDEVNELAANYNPRRFRNAIWTTRFEQIPTNAINQLYHLYQWESHSLLQVEELDIIVEFGGGYGTMCAVARRLGFLGEYHIYDLPELSLLQQYYLSNVAIPHKPANYFHWVENQRFPVPPNNVDLLIGCCSLSEVNSELREAFFGAVRPRHCLILHQNVFMGEDLSKYFSHFIKRQDKYIWFQKDYPYMETHYYLIGSKLNE